LRKKEETERLQLTDRSSRVARSDEWVFVKDSQWLVSGAVFEELVWPELFPVLSITLQTQTADKLVETAAKCLLQMMLVACEHPENTLLIDSTANALFVFSGMQKDYPLLNPQPLIDKEVYLTSLILEALNSNLRLLKPVWKFMFEFLSRIYELHTAENPAEYNQSETKDISQSYFKPSPVRYESAQRLFAIIRFSDVDAIYRDVNATIKTPSEFRELFQILGEVSRKELTSRAKPVLYSFVKLFHLWEVLQGVDAETRVDMWLIIAHLAIEAFERKLKTVEPTVAEFVSVLTPLVLSLVLGRPALAEPVFETLLKIIRSKNDIAFSGLILDKTLFAAKSSRLPFGPAWKFLISLCTDAVCCASLSWRTTVKQKIYDITRQVLARDDSSCLEHKEIICDFLRMMSLKKPVDDASVNFLNLLIDFICQIAAVTLGTDLDQLRYATLDSDGRVVEHPIAVFGIPQRPNWPTNILEVSKAEDYFSNIVLPVLLHFLELKRRDMGVKIYCSYLLKSIAVIMANQSVLYVQHDAFRIFLNSYYIPVLDDCFSLGTQLHLNDLFYLSNSVKYFVAEPLLFLSAANQGESVKSVVRFLVASLKERGSNPNKSPILSTVEALSQVYSQIALDIDYKDRDALVGLTTTWLFDFHEYWSSLTNKYFEGIQEEETAVVHFSRRYYVEVIRLAIEIMERNGKLLTADQLLLYSRLFKEGLGVCLKFDDNVKNRMKYYHNFFKRIDARLPNLRLARRLLIKARLMLALRKALECRQDQKYQQNICASVLNEINFYNQSMDSLRVFRGEVNRKRGPGQRIREVPIELEYYEGIKMEELQNEVEMRKDLILEDIVPLILINIDLFLNKMELFKALVLAGANSQSLVPLMGLSQGDLFTLASSLDNEIYQRLLIQLQTQIQFPK
jgi:hypothetical protein